MVAVRLPHALRRPHVLGDCLAPQRSRFIPGNSTVFSERQQRTDCSLAYITGDHTVQLRTLPGPARLSGCRINSSNLGRRCQRSRVERWRGGLGCGLLPCQGFPVRGAISVCHAPFPPPAHQTGRADFPHPAFGQGLTLRHTKTSVQRGPLRGRVQRLP
jgi:hypothetical protein